MRSFTALCLLLAAAGCDGNKGQPAPPPPAEAHARPEAAPSVKLCEHGVPSDLCTKCRPELAAVYKANGDWCAEHGLPESHCRQCNPDLTFAARTAPADWCAEHGVPESKCTKCHPDLVAKFIEAGDYCREHGFPESVCPRCQPERAEAAGAPPRVYPPPGTRVRLASTQTAREVGIRTVRVRKGAIARTLEVVGQLDFNHNRNAELTARGGARVLEVTVDVGDPVKAGQALVVLSSAAVGADQAELAAARARLEAAKAALDREEALAQKGISPKKSVDEARSEWAAARSAYDAAAAALRSAGAGVKGSGGRYVLAAPFDGTVVGRDAVVGRLSTPEQVLIQVADLSTLWAVLEVPESDALLVRPGQAVTLTLEGVRAEPLKAKVDRVAARVDPATRSVRARVEVPNPERTLKAGLFVRARIRLGEDASALLVPEEAVQRAEGTDLVFVKEGDALYEPVAVEPGLTRGGQVEILEGLSEGAEVVTTGAFLLKTELLKSSIGAGCCETVAE